MSLRIVCSSLFIWANVLVACSTAATMSLEKAAIEVYDQTGDGTAFNRGDGTMVLGDLAGESLVVYRFYLPPNVDSEHCIESLRLSLKGAGEIDEMWIGGGTAVGYFEVKDAATVFLPDPDHAGITVTELLEPASDDVGGQFLTVRLQVTQTWSRYELQEIALQFSYSGVDDNQVLQNFMDAYSGYLTVKYASVFISERLQIGGVKMDEYALWLGFTKGLLCVLTAPLHPVVGLVSDKILSEWFSLDYLFNTALEDFEWNTYAPYEAFDDLTTDLTTCEERCQDVAEDWLVWFYDESRPLVRIGSAISAIDQLNDQLDTTASSLWQMYQTRWPPTGDGTPLSGNRADLKSEVMLRVFSLLRLYHFDQYQRPTADELSFLTLLKGTFEGHEVFVLGGNDDFANAREIVASSGKADGDNRSATKESGEPSHAGNTGGASLWWKWTSPRNAWVSFNTAGSDFDTLLAVYVGTDLSSLDGIVANDDAGGVSQSEVWFYANAGTTYHIAVDGFGGATGVIALNWAMEGESSAKYTYGSSVTCRDIEADKPYEAIDPTTSFHASDPDHLCLRIELNDVYKNADYSPLILVKCELIGPGGEYRNPLTWQVSDPRDDDPPSSWWNYYVCYTRPGIVKTYGVFNISGRWTYRIYIDDGEGAGYQLVDEKYFDIVGPPEKATKPQPSDGSLGQTIDINLSWSAGGGATSYDVYFGTDASPDSDEFKGNQSSTSYDLGTLEYEQTYYWRIDAKNSEGTAEGDVWSFTTQSAPPLINSLYPESGLSGSTVAISGSNFGDGAGWSADVLFGSVSTPGIFSWSDTAIQCLVPDVNTSAVVPGDDFEDEAINHSLWVVGGGGRGWQESDPIGAGDWEYSHTETGSPDGYLEARVWGPVSGSGLTYGAEAWIRTTRNFNDGQPYTINFTWSAVATEDHYNLFLIQITDGYIPETGPVEWVIQEEPEGTVNLLWGSATQRGMSLPSGQAKTMWSIAIDPAGTARLYDASDAGGSLLHEANLDASKPWYIRLMISDGTSSGFPAGDMTLRLYDFGSLGVRVVRSDGVESNSVPFTITTPWRVLHDWNGDGIISIVGDVPPFVDCVYFGNCPYGIDTIAVGDCNGDGILSIVGDVPCFVSCVYFGNCSE